MKMEMEIMSGTFNLIGQPYIVSTLPSLDVITSPVLFIGPAGVGKRSYAIHLARDVHPVYFRHLINPSVEEIRDVVKWSKAVAWKTNKLVIFEFDRLNVSAQSAMLKLLEEPPRGFKIIVVSTNKAVLPTIVSRCLLYRFNVLSREDLVKVQMGLGIDEHVARASAEFAEGSVSRALEYAKAQSAMFTARAMLDQRPSLAVESLIAFKSAQEISVYTEQLLKVSPSPRLLSLLNDGQGVRGRIFLTLALRR